MSRLVFRAFTRGLSAIYFRSLEVSGTVPPAGTRGRLFFANHVNGLIDPLVFLVSSPVAASPIAKSTLFDLPGIGFLLRAAGAIPVVRRRDDPEKKAGSNEEIFRVVAGRLAEGGNVLIFPEGTSHNESHILRIKSGAAHMVARATLMPHEGYITFQACAIEFEERDTFRSRALVVFGPVRNVEDYPGADLGASVHAQMQRDLTDLVVEGKDWADRELVSRIAEMFALETGHRDLATWSDFGRQVEAARNEMNDDLYRELAGKVAAYFEALAKVGVDDLKVATTEAALAIKRTDKIKFWLAMPLAIPGTALYIIPYLLPRLAVTAASKGETDVVSTIKMGAGLVVFPLWWAAISSAGLWLLPATQALALSAVAMVSPFCSMIVWDKMRVRSTSKDCTKEDLNRLAKERASLMRYLHATLHIK
jgi:glycerol-3-phosphate O-acyltransferase/dihydroxyacetone phosphate acyltransferase